jgi:hypothetical protein
VPTVAVDDAPVIPRSDAHAVLHLISNGLARWPVSRSTTDAPVTSPGRLSPAVDARDDVSIDHYFRIWFRNTEDESASEASKLVDVQYALHDCNSPTRIEMGDVRRSAHLRGEHAAAVAPLSSSADSRGTARAPDNTDRQVDSSPTFRRSGASGHTHRFYESRTSESECACKGSGGGTVDVSSAGIGQGSEFIVRLPIMVEPATVPPPR